MTIPDPLPIYRNHTPFRARCGTKFVIPYPQLLPKALADELACEVCVYPKEPATMQITPESNCMLRFMEIAGRTTLPGILFVDIESWTSESYLGTPYITTINQRYFFLTWDTTTAPPYEKWMAPDSVDDWITLTRGEARSIRPTVDCYSDQLRLWAGHYTSGSTPVGDGPYMYLPGGTIPNPNPECYLTSPYTISLALNPIDILLDVSLYVTPHNVNAGTLRLRIYE